MGTFNQSIGSEQITFQKVKDCYKTNPQGISEVFKPELGWYKPSYDWKSPTSIRSMEDDIWHLAMSGITHINFEVVDEWGTLHFADFSLNELIK